MRRFVVVAAAVGCLAFTAIRDPDTLSPIVWPVGQIDFVIQQNGSDDINDGSDLEAIRAALAAWTAVPCSDLVLADGGSDNSRAIARDGVNRITFLETNWPGGANGAGAFTTRHRNTGPTPDEWVESDIRLNGEFFQWSTDGHQERLDIQSIVTHELGHSIGLQHTAKPEATMYFSVSPGTTAGRTLDADDVNGLCFVHPRGMFACTDDEQCPLYFGQLGGADVRTSCNGGACSPGSVDYGLDCFGDGDCTNGPCARDPVGVPASEPGACSQSCASAACPAGSYCHSDNRCYLGRDDCASHDDCPGRNARCLHDLDGRWRCVTLCLENEHCRAFPGTVCHGGNGMSGTSWCREPGPGAAGAMCDHGYECASLACTEGGADPTCAPGVPGFEPDGGTMPARDAGFRDGGTAPPPADAGFEDAGTMPVRDAGFRDAGFRDAGVAITPDPEPDTEDGGCGCSSARRRSEGATGLVFVLFAAVATTVRGSRARRRPMPRATDASERGRSSRAG